MTLTDFLLARIAEDEAHRVARLRTGYLPTPRELREADRWEAECAAKRRIVEQLERHERLVKANSEKHAEASRGGIANQEQITALRTHGWELVGRREALRMAAESLVAVYAAHPDYQEEWKP